MAVDLKSNFAKFACVARMCVWGLECVDLKLGDLECVTLEFVYLEGVDLEFGDL